MQAKGFVLRREKDVVILRVCHGELCAGCQEHCSGPQPSMEIAVQDPLGVHPGQLVEFRSRAWHMLAAMLLVFWLPLLSAAGGAWIGHLLGGRWGWHQTWTLAGGAVSAFALAVATVVSIHGKMKRGSGLVITRIIG